MNTATAILLATFGACLIPAIVVAVTNVRTRRRADRDAAEMERKALQQVIKRLEVEVKYLRDEVLWLQLLQREDDDAPSTPQDATAAEWDAARDMRDMLTWYEHQMGTSPTD